MNGTNDKRWYGLQPRPFVIRTFGRHRYGGDWVVLDAVTGRVATAQKDPWSACQWVAHVLRTGHDWRGRRVNYGVTKETVEDRLLRAFTATVEEG